MKAIVYGDLQATQGKDQLFSDPSVNLQQYRVELFYSKLAQLYQAQKCDALWDLGDTTDDRTAIPIPTINSIIAGLNRFSRGNHNFKLIGNHEQYLRSTKVHAGPMFERTFEVFNSPTTRMVGDTTIALAPYPEDNEELESWISALKIDTRKSILLGHFQVAGSSVGGKTLIDGVRSEVLGKFDLVLLGHVHRHQRLIEGKECYYLGSPFQLDFGEANDPKLVAVVDTERCTAKFLQLQGFPRYSTITVEEFLAKQQTPSEDRFRVVARVKEELDEFYAHPNSSRHTVIADFAPSHEENAPEVETNELTAIDTIKAYFSTGAAAADGFSGEELAQAAIDIMQSS